MSGTNKRIGLALGGGGARGLAHVGVLRVLEEEAIHIDVLVGTSAGALVGGSYVGGVPTDEFIKKTDDYLNSEEFQSSAIRAIENAHSQNEVGLTQKIQTYLRNRFYLAQAMFRPGILSSEDFQSMIDYFIPDIQIEETRIPFRAVATDLIRGEQIVFSSGSLRRAVMASCAVPGAIEPLNSGEMCLSDGGIICLVPSSVARKEGADIVIAVAVDPDICTADEFHSAREVHDRAVEIMSHQLEHYELREADIIIRPDVGKLHWSDFSRARDLIEEGEKAARDKIEDIRHAMPVKKSWFTLKQLLRIPERV
jgi:NTE family protein